MKGEGGDHRSLAVINVVCPSLCFLRMLNILGHPFTMAVSFVRRGWRSAPPKSTVPSQRLHYTHPCPTALPLRGAFSKTRSLQDPGSFRSQKRISELVPGYTPKRKTMGGVGTGCMGETYDDTPSDPQRGSA